MEGFVEDSNQMEGFAVKRNVVYMCVHTSCMDT